MEPNNCVTNSRKSWVKKVSNLVYLYSEAWEKYFFNGSNYSNMFYHIREKTIRYNELKHNNSW